MKPIRDQIYHYTGGNAITPIPMTVRAVWVDDETVWYVRQGERVVRMTSLERFMEIVDQDGPKDDHL